MQYTIGQIYDFSGEKRKVVGFDGAGMPVTTMDLEAKVSVPRVVDEEALRETLRTEFEKQLEEERVKSKAFCMETLRLLPLEKCTVEILVTVARRLGIEVAEDTSKSELLAKLMKA